MTGGMAYLYDPDGDAARLINFETLVTCPVTIDHWQDQLRGLIEAHAHETQSRKADDILAHWQSELGNFVQICPKEMLNHLPVQWRLEQDAIPAE